VLLKIKLPDEEDEEESLLELEELELLEASIGTTGAGRAFGIAFKCSLNSSLEIQIIIF